MMKLIKNKIGDYMTKILSIIDFIIISIGMCILYINKDKQIKVFNIIIDICLIISGILTFIIQCV